MIGPDPARQAARVPSAGIAVGTRRIQAALGLLFAFIFAIASPAGSAQDGGLTLDELQQLWPTEEAPPPDGVRRRPLHAAEEPSGPPTGTPDTRSLVQRTVDAWKRQKLAMQRARELLKQPLTVPPPPSLGVECEDVDFNRMLTNQIVQTYVRQASEPEAGVLKDLVGSRRELQLLGEDPREGYELESQVADRLVGKAELLFKTTEAQPEKAIALLAFANRAGQLAQLLGDTGREQSLLSVMAAWIAKTVPSMINDVVSKHNYNLVSAIRMMTRAANAAGLNSGNVDIEKVEQQIAVALQFDLSLTFELSSTGANFGVEEWQVKAEFPLKYVIGGGEKEARAVIEGTGTGVYTRYQDRQAGSKLKMNAQSFPLAAKIEEFDACSGTAKLVVDGMYADTETYITSDGSTADLDVVKAGWMIIFEEYFAQAAYEFDVNVRNGDPIAIVSKIRKNVGVFDGVLTVRLVHNPQ